jgi:hypothetical protein
MALVEPGAGENQVGSEGVVRQGDKQGDFPLLPFIEPASPSYPCRRLGQRTRTHPPFGRG